MDADARLILPSDVVLVPVGELEESVRQRLRHDPQSWAITRPGLRSSSRVLDAHAAGLLSEFRSPATVAEAVLRFCQARESEPEPTLEEAYPLLVDLFAAGFLVEESDLERSAILPTLELGEEVAGFEILHCVQILEDTEIYQVRREGRAASLKLQRTAGGGGARSLHWEGAVLRFLAGRGVPCWLASGRHEERSYLAAEWCPGVDPRTAGSEMRKAGDRAALLGLCCALARAYAQLHALGVFHGDVHSKNALVGTDGQVRLIDFGRAAWKEAPRGLPRPGRAGVALFYEPEHARAALAGRRLPPVSAAGEQHAVAALLYHLATGSYYRDFQLAREEMFRQIAEDPPLPFAEHGLEPWPGLEAVLARALAKDPDERFAAMTDLADALEALDPPSPPRSRGSAPLGGAVSSLIDRTLERLSLEGTLADLQQQQRPIYRGAAGTALGLYRMAQVRQDAGLLSLADLWSAAASGETGDPGRETRPEERQTPGSIYLSDAGAHAAEALVAHALGDRQRQARALSKVCSADLPRKTDLLAGLAGRLLACALLHDTCRDEPDGAPAQSLRTAGEDVAAQLWQDLDARPPLDRRPPPNLGTAHGWAGFLYATLSFSHATGAPLPARLPRRLGELAEQAIPWRRGLRWRWQAVEGLDEAAGSMPHHTGWCNGSAGLVFLWTLAYRLLGDPAYLDLARATAWNTWETEPGKASLCCGLTGRAYALLNLYRHGEGRVWLDRARDLARRAAEGISRTSEPPHSLFQGELGVAVLAVDLERPEQAALPFFEEEGWDGR